MLLEAAAALNARLNAMASTVRFIIFMVVVPLRLQGREAPVCRGYGAAVRLSVCYRTELRLAPERDDGTGPGGLFAHAHRPRRAAAV
jgi:hypothetical protein